MVIRFVDGAVFFVDGAVSFNDVDDCCCGETCENCTSTPTQFQVVFGGTWGGSCSGGDCTTFSTDSPYVCDQTVTACEFLHTLASIECNSPDEIARLRVLFLFTGGTYKLRVTLEGDQSHFMHWEYDFGEDKPNCFTEDGLDTGLAIPVLSDSNTACDNTNVTCTVTSL